jgi:hypothetical protein
MRKTVWQLLTLPAILLALLLIGSPEFPALARALRTAFASDVDVPEAPSAPRTIEAPAGPVRPVQRRAEDPRSNQRRPAALVPLYLSFAALQALDVQSTLSAVRNGGREANPVMAGLVDKPATLVAVKAATGAGIVYFVERLRTRNRTAALMMMAAFDSVYATIVARNYAVGRRLRR